MKKYIPHLIVFVSSMGVMIVELAASRIISKYFGNSLYTWTGVIGIVLGGISLGNYIGGRLADRYRPRALVRPLLLVSAVLVVAVLVLDTGLQAVLSGGNPEITWNFLARTVAGIAVLFLLPASALGTISPVMAKYALEETGRIGATVGNIYAVSSIGSIVGTFLSGFVLIPLLGTRTIILVVSAALAALTFLAGGKRRYGAAAAGILAVLLAASVLLPGAAERPAPDAADPKPGTETVLYRKDTRYSNLTVKDIRRSGGTERVLIMDGLIHNRYDPADPDILLYEYERIFRVLTEHLNEGLDSGLRTLTIGGGRAHIPVLPRAALRSGRERGGRARSGGDRDRASVVRRSARHRHAHRCHGRQKLGRVCRGRRQAVRDRVPGCVQLVLDPVPPHHDGVHPERLTDPRAGRAGARELHRYFLCRKVSLGLSQHGARGFSGGRGLRHAEHLLRAPRDIRHCRDPQKDRCRKGSRTGPVRFRRYA